MYPSTYIYIDAESNLQNPSTSKCFSIPKWNIVEQHWYRLNHVYGWFIPTSLTIAVYITSIVDGGYDPGFGEKSCWFQGILSFHFVP